MSNTGVEYQLSVKDLFTSKINKATSSTEKLNNVVSTTQRSLSGLAGAFGVGVGVAGIVSFGKSVVDSLVNYEYFSASLRTLMKGDALAAKALEGQLVSLAAKTPFSLVEIQDATKQLLAYGFAGGEVTKNISMLGDVASSLKIPFSDIAYLYGTLKTQGIAYSRDINQFTTRGIPITKELAKQFGVAEESIMGMVTEGKVGFSEVEKAFQSMTSEGGMFFDMMKQQTETVGGQISAMGDNWEQLKVNIGKSQTGIISGTVSFMNTLVDSISYYFESGNRMDYAFEKFGAKHYSIWQRLLDTFNEVVTGFNMDTPTGELKKFDSELQNIVTQSSESLSKAFAKKALLNRYLATEVGDFKSGFENLDEYNRRVSLIKTAMEGVEGNIGLFKNKGEVATPTGLEPNTGATGGTNKTGTSSTTVEARGAQNFNISIDKLIETLEFHTNNLKDSSSTIKSEVTKAMLGAVNDFQLLATK